MKAQRVLMLDHQVVQIGQVIEIGSDATRFI
ncbi:hypothetical protein BH10PSE12_BH10PSE12_17490 [soil metagenome]